MRPEGAPAEAQAQGRFAGFSLCMAFWREWAEPGSVAVPFFDRRHVFFDFFDAIVIINEPLEVPDFLSRTR